jgi:uncharacterized SAM-binding protein YcdF (DUF218 family)
MFLFLSKLLPIFISPLGLAIILLVAALLLRRATRWARVCLLASLGILLIASNAWIPAMLTRFLEWQYLPLESYPKTEVIVVLGGSTSSAQYPRQIVEISGGGNRLLYAAHLYQQGVAPHLLLTGGTIDWMSENDPLAQDMAKILGMLGIPEEALWIESESRNTYENALFSQKVLAEKGIERIILVTSAMHMPRAVALFEKQGFDVIPAPADYNITQVGWDRLWDRNLTTQLFNLLPSVANLNSTTSALKEYIGIVVYSLRGWL